MARVLMAVLILALVGAAFWVAGGAGLLGSRAEPPPPVAVSPEAAASGERKLHALQVGDGVARLSDVELTSLFRYRPELWSLGAVVAPQVRMRGDTIWLSGAVRPEDLPPYPELEPLRLILPDTTRVEIAGTVQPRDTGHAAVRVTAVEIAGMPFPARYFPAIVERLGLPVSREDAGAFALPLPPGIGAAHVADGVLILTP